MYLQLANSLNDAILVHVFQFVRGDRPKIFPANLICTLKIREGHPLDWENKLILYYTHQ